MVFEFVGKMGGGGTAKTETKQKKKKKYVITLMKPYHFSSIDIGFRYRIQTHKEALERVLKLDCLQLLPIAKYPEIVRLRTVPDLLQRPILAVPHDKKDN